MSSEKSGSAKPGGSGEKTDVTPSAPEAINQSEAADRPAEVKDGLQQINGVTPEIEQALENAGINSYKKLADLTPDRLINRLKAHDIPFSLPEIKLEMIINQAREIAQARDGITVDKPRAEKLQHQIPQAKKRQFEKHWKKDWVEMANFFISFGYELTKSGEKRLQTRVIHYEGEKEQQWENIAQDSLVEWVLNQAKPSLPPDAELQSREPALKEAQPEESELSFTPLLEITDLQVSEAEAAAQGNSGLKKGKLRTEYLLRLPASAREFTEGCLSVLVETHLVNLQTNRSTIVSSEIGQLSPGEFVYEISQDFPLPATGRYQLYVSARLLPPGEASAQIQGPVIHVEPDCAGDGDGAGY